MKLRGSILKVSKNPEEKGQFIPAESSSFDWRFLLKPDDFISTPLQLPYQQSSLEDCCISFSEQSLCSLCKIYVEIVNTMNFLSTFCHYFINFNLFINSKFLFLCMLSVTKNMSFAI